MVRIRTIYALGLLAACRASAPVVPPVTPIPAPAASTPTPSGAESPREPAYVSLAAGAQHACALRDDGTVWCWGSGACGVLGDGARSASRAEPRPVPSLTDVVKIAAMNTTTCALTRAGGVSCWGVLRATQCESDDPGWWPTPVAFETPEPAVDLAVGDENVYAVLRGGGAVRWTIPESTFIQGRAPARVVPVRSTLTVSDATLVAEAQGVPCFVTRAGPVRCFSNAGERSFPYPGGLVRALIGGEESLFVLHGDGALRRHQPLADRYAQRHGQIDTFAGVTAMAQGLPGWLLASGDRVLPLLQYPAVPGNGWVLRSYEEVVSQRYAAVVGLRHPRALAVGGNFACAIDDRGALRCWGDNEFGQLAETGVRGRSILAGGTAFTGVRDLVAIGAHLCAVMDTGPARCWGTSESANALFEPGIIGSALPRAREVYGDAAGITSGTQAACALSRTGTLTCARTPPSGAPGNPDPSVDTPTLPAPAATLAGSPLTACVSLRDGRVACADTLHQAEVPVTFRVIEGLSGVSRVVGLDPAMCALFDDAPPRCWGQNTEWGLLSRTLAPSFATPTAREGLGVAVSISAGANHACAAERDGTVRCWGRGRAGQLGTGVWSERASPAVVPGAQGAVEVAVGESHSCARMQDGTVRCWGSNASGQLGDGTRRGHTDPAPVPGLDHVTRLVAGESHTCALRDDGTVWCWGSGLAGIYGDGTREARLRPTQVRGE